MRLESNGLSISGPESTQAIDPSPTRSSASGHRKVSARAFDVHQSQDAETA